MSGTLIHNGLEWRETVDEVSTPEEGFDTVTWKEVVTAFSEKAAIERFTKGQQVSGYDYVYIVDVKAQELICGAGAYSCTITARGLVGGKPYKYRFLTLPERNSYQSVIYAGYLSLPGAADVAEPRVGVNIKWISAGRPDMSIVGTQVTEPDVAPAVPAEIWDTITNPVRNIPKWWVLDSRNPEQLPGTELWMVDDVISYYQPLRPQK